MITIARFTALGLMLAAALAPCHAVELKVSRDALERTLKQQLFNGPDGRYYIEQKYWTGYSWVVIKTETGKPSGQGNVR